MEPGEGVEERRDAAAGDHPDDEAAADESGHVVDRVAHGHRSGEGGAGVGQGGRAGGGQRHGPSGPIEQGAPTSRSS